MKLNSDLEIERYLNSIYLSLAKHVEVTLSDDSTADGFFGGINCETGELLIRNFAPSHSLSLIRQKKIPLTDIKYMVVKKITQPQVPHNSANTKNQQKNTKFLDKSNLDSLDKSGELFYNRQKSKTETVRSQNTIKPPLIVKGKNAFLTDQQISDKNTREIKQRKEKVFQPWTPATPASEEEPEELGGFASDRFDQFELNKMVNKQEALEFNEDDYTTTLDLSKFNKKEIEEAMKQENEILKGVKSHGIDTRHIREERGKAELCDNEDEEKLYSAVIYNDVVFEVKESSEKAKRRFVDTIFSNWSNKKGKSSDLLETLSKANDSKSDNSGYGRKKSKSGFAPTRYFPSQNGGHNVYPYLPVGLLELWVSESRGCLWKTVYD